MRPLSEIIRYFLIVSWHIQCPRYMELSPYVPLHLQRFFPNMHQNLCTALKKQQVQVSQTTAPHSSQPPLSPTGVVFQQLSVIPNLVMTYISSCIIPDSTNLGIYINKLHISIAVTKPLFFFFFKRTRNSSLKSSRILIQHFMSYVFKNQQLSTVS